MPTPNQGLASYCQGLAWYCGNCCTPYLNVDQAKTCCTCRTCGLRLVSTRPCRMCALREKQENNLRYQKDLLVQLQRARDEAKSHGFVLVEHPSGKVGVQSAVPPKPQTPSPSPTKAENK